MSVHGKTRWSSHSTPSREHNPLATSTHQSLPFASSDNRAESASSSVGNCDTPGCENTSCTLCKPAAIDVIGARSRGYVLSLTGNLVGLPQPESAMSPSQTVRAKADQKRSHVTLRVGEGVRVGRSTASGVSGTENVKLVPLNVA